MMEIEAKFRVEQRTLFADLLRITALGPFTLLPTPGIEYQHNTYFDTLDRRLAARHYSLRVRDLGHRRIGTLKHSLQNQAGVHTREEWEVELDAGDDPHVWPASPARERALAALGGEAVQPLVTVHTQRQYMYAIRGAVLVAEISLDEGIIAAGRRTTEFCELEVELMNGQPRAELDTLIAQLQARYPLVPEPRGKKTRGLALLDQSGTTLPALPLNMPLAHTAGSRG